MPSISVLIPTYNRREYVIRAIASVEAQSLPVKEIIVVDDGGTDDTYNFVKSHKLVKYLKINHTGLPSVARNTGIVAATSDLVAFLDSDDTWLPDKLERQINQMAKDKAWLTSSNAYRLVKNEQTVLLQDPPLVLTHENLLETNWLITSTVVASRQMLIRAGLFPTSNRYKAYEDWVFWLRLATYGKFSLLNTPLALYRDEPKDSVRSSQVDYETILPHLLTDIIPWGCKMFWHHPNKKYLLKCMYNAYRFAGKYR